MLHALGEEDAAWLAAFSALSAALVVATGLGLCASKKKKTRQAEYQEGPTAAVPPRTAGNAAFNPDRNSTFDAHGNNEGGAATIDRPENRYAGHPNAAGDHDSPAITFTPSRSSNAPDVRHHAQAAVAARTGNAQFTSRNAVGVAAESIAKLGDDDVLRPWQIQRSKLTVGLELATGFFGVVYSGTYVSKNPYQDSSELKVAVKSLRSNIPDEATRKAFLLEAKIMTEFMHRNVLSLVGVASLAEPWYILTELAEFGDLRGVMSKLKEQKIVLRLDELVETAYQVSLGMEYLALRKFIHRDLACRNCLVAGEGIIKIADFGMSRGIEESADYYRASEEDNLPIRWMAIESIESQKFTLRTDVWSFAVTVWEMFTYGERPYGKMNNIMIPMKLPSGLRPEQPDNCPDDVYGLMGMCWRSEAIERPTFTVIRQRLEELRRVHRPDDSPTMRCIGELATGRGSSDDNPYRSLNAGGGATYATTDNSGATKYETSTQGAAQYATAEDLAAVNANVNGYQVLSREDIDRAQRTQEAEYGFLSGAANHYKTVNPNGQSLYHNPDDLAQADTTLPPGLSANQPWYHGVCSRLIAERTLESNSALTNHRMNDGLYLVRQSDKPGGNIIMSVIFDGTIWHYKSHNEGGTRYRFYGNHFNSIDALVSYHLRSQGGMLGTLSKHCPCW